MVSYDGVNGLRLPGRLLSLAPSFSFNIYSARLNEYPGELEYQPRLQLGELITTAVHSDITKAQLLLGLEEARFEVKDDEGLEVAKPAFVSQVHGSAYTGKLVY
jgi:hypothetical protein